MGQNMHKRATPIMQKPSQEKEMTSTKMMESHSKYAEIYHGAAICREKLENLLEEFSIPGCLFYTVGEYEEFGFNRGTGFFWLKQKSKTERKIPKVGTSYHDTKLSAFIQHRRVSKITGVKAKDFLITATVSEMHVGVPTDDKVKFVSSTGIYRVHPIAAFEPHPI